MKTIHRLGLVLAAGACMHSTALPPAIPTGDLAADQDWLPVTSVLDSAVEAGVSPGAVLGVSVGGRRMIYGTGRLGLEQPDRPDSLTLYDLASLTKVIGLTTAVMIAVDRGLLELDAPVHRYVPAFGGGSKDQVTIRHLLTHSTGLPAWRPLFQQTESRAAALALADSTPLDTVPGSVTVYSDLGAIVLTQAVESVWGTRIDTILARDVFPAIGMRHTRYLPSARLRPHIAPTERDPWRGRVLWGEVHDENAARLDGVSGHAGLFASVTDLMTFGEWYLARLAEADDDPRCKGDSPEGLRPILGCAGPLVREFTRRQEVVPGSSRALGWDTPTGTNSAGTLLSSSSFGHTGFTGTSLWVDPSRQLVLVLLTNRVHPTRENNRTGPLRRAVADRVIGVLERR
jgi:CubicO group peptidase (beta-lactamase class C family)